MESLAFVALLAALLVILHVVVVAYLYRVTLSTEAPQSDSEPATDGPARSGTDGRLGDAVERTPCPTCGVPNDPSYRFCRRCVTDLSGCQPTADGVGAGRLGS